MIAIKRHINYLRYVVRHKWFVLIAGIHFGRPSLLWLLLIHDMSKFKPSEWFPYARTFYSEDGSKQYVESDEFNYAWNDHQKCNKHHWQYWVLIKDEGGWVESLEMPDRYMLEMIADWMGAGRAITGKWGIREWYQKNRLNIKLGAATRKAVEKIIEIVKIS